MSGPEDGPEAHCVCCHDWEQKDFAQRAEIIALKEKLARADSAMLFQANIAGNALDKLNEKETNADEAVRILQLDSRASSLEIEKAKVVLLEKTVRVMDVRASRAEIKLAELHERSKQLEDVAIAARAYRKFTGSRIGMFEALDKLDGRNVEQEERDREQRSCTQRFKNDLA